MKNDASLLNNRITMLQNEENKLLRKIQNTRKRADEIMMLKERNDKKFEQRILQKENEERRLDQERQKMTAVKNLRKKAKEQRQKEILN